MKKFLVCVLVSASFAAIAGDGYKSDLSTDEIVAKYIKWAETDTYSGIYADGLFTGENVVVKEVAADSPAAKAGVMEGDVLLAINGYKLTDMSKENWKTMKASIQVGDTVAYKIARNNDYKKIKVTVAAIPMDLAAKKLGYALMKAHKEKMTATASTN